MEKKIISDEITNFNNQYSGTNFYIWWVQLKTCDLSLIGFEHDCITDVMTMIIIRTANVDDAEHVWLLGMLQTMDQKVFIQQTV